MPDIAQHLRLSEAELDLHEVLISPITILLGVDEAAAGALEALGLKTVFDLGTSALFAQVDAVLGSDWAAIGSFPADLLTQSAIPAALDDLPSQPLESLRGVSASVATSIKTALGVDTLRDFGMWPPRSKARDFVAMAIGTDLGVEADGLAERLRPAMGEYPTERVYYDKLVMFGGSGDQSLQPLQGTISLASPEGAQNGLKIPAVGALVTLSQSWFSQGVTLGHMLHSLALAPGEATRVAVVDWERRSRAATTETIAEAERLDSASTHSRAISEVQNAVASEMQQGESMSDGWSESSSGGSNFSASAGGGAAGIIQGVAGVFGFSIGGSSSDQYARTDTYAHSASWSVGSRAASAFMAQNVNDRTEQHASSVRSRRASAVREVSQSEHEQISTRVVANYNHMHALTVQYYEVVQVYRVVVRTHAVERVLFLPFEILDFSASSAMELVDRYRGQLVAAALTRRGRELLIDRIGQIEVRSGVRVETPINIFTVAAGGVLAARAAVASESSTGSSGGGGATVVVPTPRMATVIRRGPVEQSLPGNALLVRISFEGLAIAKVRLEHSAQADPEEFNVPSNNDLPLTNVRLAGLSAIQIGSSDGAEDSGTVTLHCEIDGRVSKVAVPIVLGSGTRMQTAAFIDADPSDREGELMAHLQANRAYYTRAVLGRLDSASLVMLLAPFSWNGKPLADQVEPRAVTVAGNYLVLRAPAVSDEASGIAGETWGVALAARSINLTDSNTRLVPIPTGGVFAEAVLGRSNSAEKLDLTRFWNWQDSPIPLQPTEIAPVSAGSRAQTENLVPGQLGAPVLNIMNPTALPDPSGLSAIIGAIANGNMFRDMSGLAGTQAAAQAMSAGTLSAATDAGRINSENYRIAAQQATEMAKTAADMWKVYQNSKSKDGEGSNKSLSAEGARVNHGRDMDERGIKRPGSGGNGSVPESSTSSLSDNSSGSIGAGANETASNELVRADSGAEFSPQLASEMAGGLADVLEAKFPGVETEFTGGARLSSSQAGLLKQLGLDLSRVGLSLRNISILPLQRHKLGVKFLAIPFAAWTNSARTIYYNFDQFHEMEQKFIIDWGQLLTAGPMLTVQETRTMAEKFARVMNLLTFHHELQHISQFKTNGSRPKTFNQMAVFESNAYGGDKSFINDQNNISLLESYFGIPKWFLDGDQNQAGFVEVMDDFYADRVQFFDGIASLPNQNDVRDKMIADDLLPSELKNGDNGQYKVDDLYRT